MADPKERPSFVKCVAFNVGPAHARHGESWCGRKRVYFLSDPRDGREPVVVHNEWAFIDTDHALLSALAGDRLLICPACAKAIGEALAKGTHAP